MRERVIVAVDGGEASAAAVRWVAQRARSTPMDVTVLTVADTTWLVPDPTELEYRERYQEVLEDAATTLAANAENAQITQELRHGRPADELIAASGEADLLVLGTNKTGPIAGLIHGTIPLRVAGRARCVTVVVPATWRTRGTGVVVGWNGDSTSNVALDFAVEEATTRGGSLTVVRAAHLPPRIIADSRVVVDTANDVVERQGRELTEVAGWLQATHPGLEVHPVLRSERAAAVIVEAAQAAELVVVGSHARGVLGGLILGSVSHDVLLNMPGPVAVVPPPEEPVPAPAQGGGTASS
jgi:nucleotide-binding universal stress UspA family protein